MSHFSKIKTNISNIEILKKTLKDLDFNYNLSNSNNNYQDNDFDNNNIVVFADNLNDQPLFSFSWNGKEFMLIADLYLWNLDISVKYFLEKLSQQYAYNTILYQSLKNGFKSKVQTIASNGSIKLVVEKWHSNL